MTQKYTKDNENKVDNEKRKTTLYLHVYSGALKTPIIYRLHGEHKGV